MSLLGGYWNYTFSKIEIIMSDISDYEIIKIYFMNGELAEESMVKQGNGIKFVYDVVLKHYIAMCERELPEVWVHDIKTRVLKYKIN